MAGSDIDVNRLDASQQVSLQTYTSVTNQDLSAAIPLLERSQWNVQIAIAKFFDGEVPDPLEEARRALASSPPPPQSVQRETLLNGSPTFPSLSRPPANEPAPRIVPQAENQTTYKPPLLFALLFTPFTILYRILSGSVGLFSYLFPFLPRLLSARGSGAVSWRQNIAGRIPLNPRDTASRFAREFEEEYGNNPLHFYEGGYAQAYDVAKRDLKFLLVLLFSPEHDDTSTFVRETLLSQDVVNFINDPQNKVQLWAGSVQDSEAYQVSTALNCTKFPFAALIVHTPQDSSTKMSTIARISGLLPPTTFVPRLQSAMNQHSGALERVRATRAEQQATRNLREEQNSAYESSLAQDRERVRRRREAEAIALRAEQEAQAQAEAAQQLAQNQYQWRKWRAQCLLPEPDPEVQDTTRVSIRMPTGERIVRKFAGNAPMEELYAFVDCSDILQKGNDGAQKRKPQGYEHVYGFRLVSPMPRVVYGVEERSVGRVLGRSGNLIVELLEEDEEE